MKSYTQRLRVGSRMSVAIYNQAWPMTAIAIDIAKANTYLERALATPGACFDCIGKAWTNLVK